MTFVFKDKNPLHGETDTHGMLPSFKSKIKKKVIKVKKHVISRDKMEIEMGWLATYFFLLVG